MGVLEGFWEGASSGLNRGVDLYTTAENIKASRENRKLQKEQADLQKKRIQQELELQELAKKNKEAIQFLTMWDGNPNTLAENMGKLMPDTYEYRAEVDDKVGKIRLIPHKVEEVEHDDGTIDRIYKPLKDRAFEFESPEDLYEKAWAMVQPEQYFRYWMENRDEQRFGKLHSVPGVGLVPVRRKKGGGYEAGPALPGTKPVKERAPMSAKDALIALQKRLEILAEPFTGKQSSVDEYGNQIWVEQNPVSTAQSLRLKYKQDPNSLTPEERALLPKAIQFLNTYDQYSRQLSESGPSVGTQAKDGGKVPSWRDFYY